MSDFNAKNNRAVWFDVPVVDLDRAVAFYRSVLDIKVDKGEFNGCEFGVLEHADGNGGCLVKSPSEVTAAAGILVYLNVSNRIRDAVSKVEGLGGRIVQPIHAIGPHGFRAVITDCEGNRVALHSHVDA